MKVNNEQSDYGLLMRSRGSIYQVLDPKSGAIVSLIMSVVSFAFGIGAFILRIFLRQRLGSRSFGLMSITFSYLWVKWVESIHYNQFVSAKNTDFITIIEYILDPIIQFADRLLGNNTYAPRFSPPLIKTGLGDLLTVFSWTVLILGIVHYISAFVRNLKKAKWHSYHRGESLLFGWLKGKRFFNNVITDTTIWMLIEPLFVLLISIPLSKTPDGAALAFVLRTSAACLFFQEYLVFQKKNGAILDLIDQEIESEEIFNEVNQRQRLRTDTTSPQSNPVPEVIL
ncbi:MAG: hypothetical protein JNL70_11765 [Saprospiraceae bacterium]|nr:hypothetical protein [Saprospiraceae bacterium]